MRQRAMLTALILLALAGSQPMAEKPATPTVVFEQFQKLVGKRNGKSSRGWEEDVTIPHALSQACDDSSSSRSGMTSSTASRKNLSIRQRAEATLRGLLEVFCTTAMGHRAEGWR